MASVVFNRTAIFLLILIPAGLAVQYFIYFLPSDYRLINLGVWTIELLIIAKVSLWLKGKDWSLIKRREHKFTHIYPQYYSEEILLGYDKKEAVALSSQFLLRHGIIQGASGFGKTVLYEDIILGIAAIGGGGLFIDAKPTVDAPRRIYSILKAFGREDDFMMVDFSNSKLSNRYSPVWRGTSMEIADRLMSLYEKPTGPAGYYYDTQKVFMESLVGALLKVKSLTGKHFCIGDVLTCFLVPEALQELANMLPECEEKAAIGLAISNYRTPGGIFDQKRFLFECGRIARVLQSYLIDHDIAEVINCVTPEVDIYDVIVKRKFLYVPLPVLRMKEKAYDFAKMFMLDMLSAVGKMLMQKLKTYPPSVMLCDEAARYVDETTEILSEQMRAAGVSLWLAMQTAEKLREKGLYETFMTNSYTKVNMRAGSARSAKSAAEESSEETKIVKTVSKGVSEGMSGRIDNTIGSSTKHNSISVSEREIKEYRINPFDIQNLEIGEAFVMRGTDIKKIRVPYVNVKESEIELFRYNYSKPESGIGLFSKYQKMAIETSTAFLDNMN